MPVSLSNSPRRLQWLSFLLFFIGFVLFFVAYTGNSWYRTPYDPMAYPPDSPYLPVSMGLFWMCANGHCKYDLRVDYMVVAYMPYKEIQDAFQNYRTVCMAIETIAAICCLAALALNLIVLSGFKTSPIIGFVAGGLEILAGIIALIGLVIYAAKFRGPTKSTPFGWSFWMMIAAMIILMIDGVLTAIITAFTLVYVHRKQQQQSAMTRPLASGF